MKKNYVNLDLDVVKVQLSDCIAGSVPSILLTEGTTDIIEVDTRSSAKAVFSTWGNN